MPPFFRRAPPGPGRVKAGVPCGFRFSAWAPPYRNSARRSTLLTLIYAGRGDRGVLSWEDEKEGIGYRREGRDEIGIGGCPLLCFQENIQYPSSRNKEKHARRCGRRSFIFGGRDGRAPRGDAGGASTVARHGVARFSGLCGYGVARSRKAFSRGGGPPPPNVVKAVRNGLGIREFLSYKANIQPWTPNPEPYHPEWYRLRAAVFFGL